MQYPTHPLQSYIAMSMLPELNSGYYYPVVEDCGGIEGFFMESPKARELCIKKHHLPALPGNLKKVLSESIREIGVIEKHDIRICTYKDYTYPYLLEECPDRPLVFYYKGDLSDLNHHYLAIVGTRKASDLCRKRVESVVQGLSRSGESFVIVSGLAYGIDISAHQAALKYGLKTYAVLGQGLHTVYPATHRNIAQHIINSGGALISEFPSNAPILPVNFLKRNRIVAGICKATLIAESANKGGAMATARIAASYSRDVLAFPGRPEDKMSAGCNLLIKENVAALVESSTDILNHFDIKISEPEQITISFPENDTDETLFLRFLKENSTTNKDEYCRHANIPVTKLTPILLKLELEGKIISLPGNHYVLK